MIDTFSIRCKLIDLALSGMLSKQYTNEVVTFEHKESKKWTRVSEEEKYYTIPTNWKYLRVGEIAVINPKNDIDDEMEVSFIPMVCVQDGFSNKHTSNIKQWKDIKKGFVHFINGDIGVAKITPCFQNRKSVIFKELSNGYGAGTTELTIIRPEIGIASAEYMLYFFQSAIFISKGIESFTGVVGQQRIHKDYIKTSPIPLPPYEEQIRIVDKLNVVFEILDTIEDLQLRYVADFKVLKSKIIDAGIQGKLTNQLSDDGTAEDLYVDIQAKKERLIKEGKIKKEKTLPEISEEEIPFEIPENWKWVRLGNLCTAVTGRLDANQKADDGKYPFFTCGQEVYMTTDYAFDCDAVLLGGNNASGDYKMHRYCGKFNAYQRVYVISGQSKETLDYLFWVIKYWLPHLKYNSQGANTRFIKIGQVLGMLIPLPPYAEQVRIVERIDELLSLM